MAHGSQAICQAQSEPIESMSAGFVLFACEEGETEHLFVRMINDNNMTNQFVLLLLFLKVISGAGTVSFTVAILDNTINAITNYTFVLSLSDTSSRNSMTFTFPSAAATTNNTNAYLTGSNTPIPFIANSSTSVTLNTAALSISSPLSIVFTNIANPYSAITSVTSFTFSSNTDSAVGLSLVASKNYAAGALGFCSWSFNQCTEQSNSLLAISLVTTNHIPAGAQTITVRYPTFWVNQNQKSLYYGSSSITCSLNFNGGANITSGVTCSNTNTSLTVSFTLSSPVSGSSTIIFYVLGVMSPPTAITPSNSLYTARTADANGYSIDASTSSCIIQPTCVTNFSNGVIAQSGLRVNSQITSLQTNFNAFPTITFMYLDSVEVIYSPSSSLVGCSLFRVLRNASAYDLTNNSTGTTMSYYFGSQDSLPNYFYSFSISVYIECTSITAPQSETPTIFTYKFKRNGEEYLRLSATFTATAATFNASTSALALLSYQMGTATTYSFAFTIGQPLSSAPQFVIALPSQVVVGTLTCKISVAGSALSSTPCSAASSSLAVNYASATSIGAGSAVVIEVVGLTNPMQPIAYTFGLSTYYNSTLATSRVQTNSAAFTATYTAITSLPVTLSPNAFTVYTTTSTTLSFTSPVPIPALSTFTVTFPSEATQLAASLHVLSINGSASLITATPSITTTSVVFSNSDVIAAGSSVMITVSIRSPPYVNTFSYVQFTVTKGNVTYMQSLTSMQIQVTTPGTMLVSITPSSSLTGATSPYLITLSLSIPHAASFLLQVDFATDVLFVSTNTSCAGICSSLNAVSNTLKIMVNNPSPNATTSTISLTITSFTNPRTTGAGATWTFSTFTSLLEPISVETAFPTVGMTNILTGQLQSTDSYYRNNSNTVKMSLALTNLLKSIDYLLFSMDRITYNVNSLVNCSSIYGLCAVDSASTTNLLVIRVVPNSANINANPLPIYIEGLISGSSTGYLQTDYITVGSYTSTGGPIDQGRIAYNIDCRDSLSLPNNCRTCDATGACLSCYTSIGYFQNGSTCVTSCGSATTYYSFANSTSGQCVSCASPTTGCLTCVNETACLSCLTASYYLYPATQKCSILCPTTAGYLVANTSGIRTCVPCADSNCLVCTTQAYGSCTLCSNTSILVSGMCSSNCPSTSYFVLSGSCIACDPSCYSCTSSTNTSCTVCAVGYYNSSGVCTNSCPTGKAIIPSNGTCGCASDCLTCDSANYANCTTCNNISLFVYSGQCLSACPTGSYLSVGSCIACSSGCNNCTSSSCIACLTGYFSYSGSCYGDCNLLGTQYDSSVSTCVLCPSGCDTCISGSCTSCLTDFTLSGGVCVDTCKLTNSCSTSGNVLPLPGCIAVAVWAIVVLLVRHFSHQTYVPYSLIIISSLAEFALVLALIVQSSPMASTRLLAASSNKNVILSLLGLTIALNYLANALYICMFVRYLRPLIVKLQQIDIITHTATLIVGFVTNYRFAMVAFSRMFPRPRMPVDMEKHLTPVHYLCFTSLICSIFPIVACVVILGQQTRLSISYMLSLDLLIVIVLNDLVTVWFISAKKDDSYFQEENKKAYAEEDINVTKENIQKDIKDDSQANIVHSLTHSDKISKESDDYDFGESYKKLRSKKARFNASPDTVLIRTEQSNQHAESSFSAGREQKRSEDRNIFAIDNDYEPEPSKDDVNFEERITKRNPRHNQSRKRTPPNFSKATTGMQDRAELPFKSIELDETKFEKDLPKKKEDFIRQDLSEDIESDLQESLKMDSRISVNFDEREHLPRPIRISTNANLAFKKAAANELRKDTDGKANQSMMNKPRYAQSQATNAEKGEQMSEDLAAIIRLKVQESALRRSNQAVISAEQDLDEVSPSYYNIQNQRFHISNLDDTDQ